LPEWIGGTRNWDYRYCWLRDATFTLLALINAGYFGEARSLAGLAVARAGRQSEPGADMYGLSGERRLVEWEADWLPGYETSRPVRIGNAASQQMQLDIFGEMLDSFFTPSTA